LGILIASLTNYPFRGVGPASWRWMLGAEALPAAVFVGSVSTVPKSPRSLVGERGALQEARAALLPMTPATAESELKALMTSGQLDSSSSGEKLFSKKYSLPVMLAVLFAVFNQVSGINAIIYYAPRIFEMTGIGKDAALLSTAGIGLVNFLF